MRRQFWHLSPTFDERKQAWWDHEVMDLEQVVCPVNPGHMRAGKRLMDLHVVLPRARVLDFVWTPSSECLIQEHVLELFRDHGFTGFEVKPVRARFRHSNQPPPTLWEVAVTGWGGMAQAESGIHLDERRSCSACGFLHYTELDDPSALIDQSQWDGSDFFIVWPLPRFILITDRVTKLINEKQLLGKKLVPINKLMTDHARIGDMGFSPGRLRYSMPEKRARELGEPLGIF